MVFPIITFVWLLPLPLLVAWFSIIGLMAIFAGLWTLPVALMAGSLEVGKLVAASWAYQLEGVHFIKNISNDSSCCFNVHHKYGHFWFLI